MTLAFFVFIGAAQSVSAATFTVSNTADSGAGSLRQAIADANAIADADTIVFASPLFDTAQTINLTSATLAISQSVTITGRGARLLTVRRAINNPTNFRIFDVSGAAAVVSISGITISNGNVPDGSGGGGVLNNGGTLLLNFVAISGNTATADGGGIGHAFGTMTILNSTVSGNTVGGFGGGICVSNGTVNIANSTVSGNSASSGGGGIDNSSTLNMNNVTVTNNRTTNGNAVNAGGVLNFRGTVNTRNSIIAGNFATGGDSSPDVRGAFRSNGNNLIGNTTGSTGFTQSTDKTGVAANLAPLANNGGQTDTHALNAGSPAIDQGDNCVIAQSCIGNNPPAPLTTDQRGTNFPRQVGAALDIGAFEAVLAPTAGEVTIGGRAISARGRGISNVIISLTNSSGILRTTRTGAFGRYVFREADAGETYIITAKARRYTFSQPTQVINVSEDQLKINFIANP